MSTAALVHLSILSELVGLIGLDDRIIFVEIVRRVDGRRSGECSAGNAKHTIERRCGICACFGFWDAIWFCVFFSLRRRKFEILARPKHFGIAS